MVHEHGSPQRECGIVTEDDITLHAQEALVESIFSTKEPRCDGSSHEHMTSTAYGLWTIPTFARNRQSD